MMYTVDQNLAGLAKELRKQGIPCETITKLVNGNEDSRVSVHDPVIVKYLRESKGQVTLITADAELAEYCRLEGILHIFSWDLIIERVKGQIVKQL